MNNNEQAHCDEDKGPLVSAIIPTYKRPKLVTRAIRSVLNQTVQDIEIIVVDDASPDDTETAVLSVGSSRVRYIRHESNRGLPASRNTGIHAARGKFIAFLDDDDEWLPEKTAKQLRYIQEKDVDAVVGMSLINGTVPTESHPHRLITVADLRKGNRWGSCSLFVKAQVIREILFDESLTVGEEWDTYIRLTKKYRLACLNEPVFIYHQIGPHAAAERMLKTAKHQEPALLEQRLGALHKHRLLLGENCYRRLLARELISYIGVRRDRYRQVRYAIERCGTVAVVAALTRRLYWHVRQLRWTGANWIKHGIVMEPLTMTARRAVAPPKDHRR